LENGGQTAVGTGGRDLFYFESDNSGVQQVYGGSGDDVYIVRYLPGQLTGGDPRIVESSGGGNDSVWVSQSDYILPNGVENLVSMTERGVRMLANDGDNKFIGGPGSDMLFSGYGDDIVYGREGDDLIVGGDGADVMFGCEGNDTFAWELSHIGVYDDRIMDWNDGDRIDLRGVTGYGVIVWQGNQGAEVWLDVSGDGARDFLIATLIGVTSAQLQGAILT
jgi:Ca2+-binding RTX toxin-like protein